MKRHVIDRRRQTGAANADCQIADSDDRPSFFIAVFGHARFPSLGSSASLKASPIRLMLSTVSAKTAPGKKIMPGSNWKYVRPSDMMLPHDGTSGGNPTPRKLSAASVRIAEARMKEPWMIR